MSKLVHITMAYTVKVPEYGTEEYNNLLTRYLEEEGVDRYNELLAEYLTFDPDTTEQEKLAAHEAFDNEVATELAHWVIEMSHGGDLDDKITVESFHAEIEEVED